MPHYSTPVFVSSLNENFLRKFPSSCLSHEFHLSSLRIGKPKFLNFVFATPSRQSQSRRERHAFVLDVSHRTMSLR